jgi:hypothetical protein
MKNIVIIVAVAGFGLSCEKKPATPTPASVDAKAVPAAAPVAATVDAPGTFPAPKSSAPGSIEAAKAPALSENQKDAARTQGTLHRESKAQETELLREEVRTREKLSKDRERAGGDVKEFLD